MPKTVTRQRRDCDLNPDPCAPESSTLTARLPSHPERQCTIAKLAVCLFPSVRSRSSIETAGRIELVFGKEASLTYPILCQKRSMWISKNKAASTGTVSRVWTGGQTELTVLATVDTGQFITPVVDPPLCIQHEAGTCSVLYFSRPRSEGWPHHGPIFSIYLCSPLSF